MTVSRFKGVEELEERLSRPTPDVVEAVASLDGDLLILGVGGKMGPTLAMMARRAVDEAGSDQRVIGVARFSDPSVREKPWSEFAPVPTRLGLARPDGPEAFLSDPLGSYHSHLNVSPDGRFLSGEGTHNHPFVCAAAFDISSTRVNFVPQATIHTRYTPMGGHGLQADFTADSHWILYHDTIDGEFHVCAVRVEL